MMGTKRCSRCGRELPRDEEHFHKQRKSKDGLNSRCKECSKERARVWNAQNSSRKRELDRSYVERNREKIRMYQKWYREQNKERLSIYQKEYARKNGEYLRRQKREYFKRPEVRERENARQREARRFSRKHSLTQSMRSAISGSLNGRVGAIGNAPWTVEELYKHIEAQFVEGMTWGNYGEWHVDHIIPASHFCYSSPNDEDFRACWSLANLRPVWASENLSKNDSILFLL